MSFDTPRGTRGGRLPGGKLMAWVNTWNMNRIRRGNADKVMGMRALVLTTVGAKSGAPRHTPLAYFPESADSWLIVASANGAAKNPAWYYNLAAHPDVQIQIAGRTIAVSAEQLRGNARQQAWDHITGTAKRYAKHEQKTDRELPVIRLRTRQLHRVSEV